METIKDDRLSILYQVFPSAEDHVFSVAVIAGFSLGSPDEILEEGDMWAKALDALNKKQVLDLAMPKTNGEALVAGKCFSPKGKPTKASQVSFRVGTIQKRVNVSGDRWWKGGLGGRTISEAAPFSEMGITWENAFGGPGFEQNPVGKGIDPVDAAHGDKRIPLPNVEDPRHMIGSLKDKPKPVGFAPLGIDWPVRSKNLGTFDDRWLRNRWPGYPDDFDWNYFNIAPKDQRMSGYFTGKETIEIERMHPEKPLIQSKLPGIRARCFVNRLSEKGDNLEELSLRLDTVWLFPHLDTGVSIWHGTSRTADDEASDVTHILTFYESLAEQPKPEAFYKEKMIQPAEEILPASAEAEPAAFPGLGTAAKISAVAGVAAPTAAIAGGAPTRAGGDDAGVSADSEKIDDEAVDEAGIDQVEEKAVEGPTLEEPEEGFDLEDFPELVDPEIPVPQSGGEVVDALKDLGIEDEDLFNKLHKLDEDVQSAREEHAALLEGREPPAPSTPEPASLESEPFPELAEPKAAIPQSGAGVVDELKNLGIEDQSLSDKLHKLDGDVQRAREEHAALLGEIPPETPPVSGPEMPDAEEPPELEKVEAAEESEEGMAVNGEEAVSKKAKESKEKVEAAEEMQAAEPEKQKAEPSGVSEGVDAASVAGAAIPGAGLAAKAPSGAENCPRSREELEKGYGQKQSFSGCDLTGFDLSDLELPGIDLSDAVLEEANLSGANLEGAKLAGALLTGADLTGARMNRADLSAASAPNVKLIEAKLEDANFSDADLFQADLSNTHLNRANLQGANLADASLRQTVCRQINARGANFTGADFTEADLNRADLTEADMTGATLAKTNLTETRLQNVWFSEAKGEKTIFTDADMKGSRANGITDFPDADFSGAKMEDASWENVNLSETRFRHADLNRAMFVNCNFRKADFYRAQAKKADFSKSDFTLASMVSVNLFQGALRKARLVQADFRGANLYEVDFYKAVISRTNFEQANVKNTLVSSWKPE